MMLDLLYHEIKGFEWKLQKKLKKKEHKIIYYFQSIDL